MLNFKMHGGAVSVLKVGRCQTQVAMEDAVGVRRKPGGRVKILNPRMLQAKALAHSGVAVFPLYEPAADGCSCGNPKCGHVGKHPRTSNGVKNATTDLKVITDWWMRWPNANIGVATGAISNLTVVDIDGNAAKAAFLQISGLNALPVKATVVTARGHHIYYRPDGLVIGNSTSRLAPGIDVRGDGGYVVAPGSRHASGTMYRVLGWSIIHQTIVPESVPSWLAALGSVSGSETIAAATEHVSQGASYGAAALQGELAKLLAASNTHRNDTLNRCAFRLGQLCTAGAIDEATVVERLTRTALVIGLDADEIGPTIRSGLNAGMQAPRSPSQVRTSGDRVDKSEVDALAAQLSTLPHTDAGNANRLVKRHGGELLWTPGHKWHCYDGKVWVSDATKRRVTLALDAVQKIVDEAPFTNDGSCRKHALSSQSKSALDRMLSLAEPQLAKPDAALDADPWKLCVENGTLDLKTGALSPHTPLDLITRLVPSEFDVAAECPRFDAFLRHALKGDDDLIYFVQKAVGMCLTGVNREQVFFVLHGSEGTGKSTFVNLIRDMLGGYGMHTAMDTWIAKKAEPATQPDLARLKGARVATAIEANFGQPLDEAKLKGITGGEPITCRGLYQSTFEYVPQFKLWFAVNDLPVVRDTANAFWRRARVISFDVPIDKEQLDLDLDNKLRAELPGILAWAVRGCTAWLRDGLAQPPAVNEATKQWKVEVDHVKRFVRDKLIRDPTSPIQSSFIYSAYTEWCGRQGEQPKTTKAFKAALEAENFEHYRREGRSYWRGMRLRTD